jgi:beta-1,4-mannosyltransferase
MATDAGLLSPVLVLVLLFATFFVYALTRPRRAPRVRTAAVLVLGDVGRSPRMMYHAESLAKQSFETYVVGYDGARPIPSLLALPHVHFLYLPAPPALVRALPFVLLAPLKIVHQCLSVLYTLLVRIPAPPEFLLVQVRTLDRGTRRSVM